MTGRGRWVTIQGRRMMMIETTDEEEQECGRIARVRQGEGERYDRVPGNGLRASPENDLRINDLGVRCEYAFHVAAPHYEWHKLARRIDKLPDFDRYIDVKGTNQRENWPLRGLSVIPYRVRRAWAYVSVLPWGRCRYLLVGYAWGTTVANAELVSFQPDRPQRSIKAEQLLPIDAILSNNWFIHPCLECGDFGPFGFHDQYYCQQHCPR